jgi:hypothetical protein
MLKIKKAAHRAPLLAGQMTGMAIFVKAERLLRSTKPAAARPR